MVKNTVVTKTLRYYLHPNNYDADACEIVALPQSMFTTKTSEKQVITSELKIIEAGSTDPDLTNNSKSKSLTISSANKTTPSYATK